jgi:succinate-semialdehyde dehydrogenase / glutarate-semialdehyde dehydrogenase
MKNLPLAPSVPSITNPKKVAAYQSVNPFNGKVGKAFATLTDRQLETKLAAAATCFAMWRHKSYSDRAVIVAKAAALLHDQADAFAHIMTLEMGKRIGEARGEVEFSSQILAYYAKNAERFLAPVKLEVDPVGWTVGSES